MKPAESQAESNFNMNHFNELTPAEAERLSLLLEECGEVLQIIGKIQRHGYDSADPTKDDGLTNRDLLEYELGHLSAAVTLLMDFDLSEIKICDSMNIKVRGYRDGKYLHHNP